MGEEGEERKLGSDGDQRGGLILKVGPGAVRCVTEILYKGIPASISARAIPRSDEDIIGGRSPLHLSLTTPKGEEARETTLAYDTILRPMPFVATESGLWEICLESAGRRNHRRPGQHTLDLAELLVSSGRGQQEQQQQPAETQNTPVERLFQRATEATRVISLNLEGSRAREAGLLSASQSVTNRVSLFGYFSVVVLVGVCVWQITCLKRFFKSKKLL